MELPPEVAQGGCPVLRAFSLIRPSPRNDVTTEVTTTTNAMIELCDIEAVTKDVTVCQICYMPAEVKAMRSIHDDCGNKICDICYDQWFIQRRRQDCPFCRQLVVATRSNGDAVTSPVAPSPWDERKLDCFHVTLIWCFCTVLSLLVFLFIERKKAQ